MFIGGRMAPMSYWLEPGLMLKLSSPKPNVIFIAWMSATQFFQTFDATRSQPLNPRGLIVLKSKRRFFGAR
jgi:hypothetical protein